MTPRARFCISTCDAREETRPVLLATQLSYQRMRACTTRQRRTWGLDNLTGYSCGTLAKIICDTGASVTAVSSDFVKRAGLTVRPLSPGATLYARTPNGQQLATLGLVDIPLSIQLMLAMEVGDFATWQRQFVLKKRLCFSAWRCRSP